MKKALILCYDFPPYVSVGGLRPKSWFDYLKDFGIKPYLITRNWSNIGISDLEYISPTKNNKTVIEILENGVIFKTPYKPNLANKMMLKFGEKRFRKARKLISAFYEIGQFILPIGPKRVIYQEAKKFLKENKVDIIIVTGDPFILFKYAKKLGDLFKIPWVGDYRDLWSQDYSFQNKPTLKFILMILEKKIIKEASCVITVSEYLSKKISKFYGGKIHIIPNGYDFKNINLLEKISQSNDILTISYAGTIYNWHPVMIFLNAIKSWVDSKKSNKIKIQFFGINKEKEIMSFAKKNIQSEDLIIKFIKKIPNEILVRNLMESNLLLLFNDYNLMGTKIYNYLATKRKILLCFKNDELANNLKKKFYFYEDQENINNNLQENLINYTSTGIVINDTRHLKEVLSFLNNEFNKTKKIEVISENLEKFSRFSGVKEVSNIIKANISKSNIN